jgi:hypothetical protein
MKDTMSRVAMVVVGIGFGLLIPAVIFWMTAIASAALGNALHASDQTPGEVWLGLTAAASPIDWLIAWSGFLVVLLVICLSARLLCQGVLQALFLLDRLMTWSPTLGAGAAIEAGAAKV